jgi:hypothetical protein
MGYGASTDTNRDYMEGKRVRTKDDDTDGVMGVPGGREVVSLR